MFILSKYSCFGTENISSFLPSSLLSALEECFPAAKWNHTHKVQHKVSTAASCLQQNIRKELAVGWFPQRQPVPLKPIHPKCLEEENIKCQVLVHNLHHPPWDLHTVLLALNQKSLCSYSQTEGGTAITGMFFLEWGQEEPEKRDFQKEISFWENYCHQLTWLCQYDTLLLVTQLRWLWSRASSVILNCNVKWRAVLQLQQWRPTYLTGIHVLGKFYSPSAIAMTGITPWQVDTGLFTELLFTFIYIYTKPAREEKTAIEFV